MKQGRGKQRVFSTQESSGLFGDILVTARLLSVELFFASHGLLGSLKVRM